MNPVKPNYLDPTVLAQIEGLALRARLVVEGFVAGMHRSPWKGMSVEFAEHREYTPGDDLRYLDWKVYGRSDRFYLKQFEEETNFACHLVIDGSGSMGYRSERAAMSKWDYGCSLAAAMAYLVIRQQDAAGVALFSEQVDEIVRPSSQPSHLQQLVHVLESHQPTAEPTPGDADGATHIGTVLHQLAERLRVRGLVVLISDLFDDPAELESGLKHLRHQGHDVSVLHVIDPAEEDFPFDDPTRFKDLEVLGEELIEPRALRAAYQQEFTNFLKSTERCCRRLHVEYSRLRSDESLAAGLMGYVSRRAAKR